MTIGMRICLTPYVKQTLIDYLLQICCRRQMAKLRLASKNWNTKCKFLVHITVKLLQNVIRQCGNNATNIY